MPGQAALRADGSSRCGRQGYAAVPRETREPPRPPTWRELLDEAFPTVIRYTGLVLTVVLVVFTIRGRGVDLAAGYVAAAGMILYKTVHNGAKEGGE